MLSIRKLEDNKKIKTFLYEYNPIFFRGGKGSDYEELVMIRICCFHCYNVRQKCPISE